jgi:hypothetical protein
MAYTEKELEKKTLAELAALVLGHEEKIKELAGNIKAGLAKPTDMMTWNSNLAMLRKVRDKKMQEHSNSIPHERHKAAAPMKSYDDFLKSHK